MRLAKKDFLVGLLYLILTLLFFLPFLSGQQLLGFKDLSRYFYPLRYLMVEQVKAGFIPLWNPYIFCGYPLLATLQVGFFYPLSLIYYLLPFNLAFNYYIILHYFLAAWFFYLMLGYFNLQRPAAFVGGLIFAFCGYLLSVSNMNTSLSSVIWLPLLVITFDLLLKQISYWRMLALTMLIAIMFLGGEPTIIYVSSWLLVFYAFVFAVDIKKAVQVIGRLIVCALGALMLSAIQLLPFIELAQLSDRVVRNVYSLVTFRSFPPRELINFIFPFFFGNPAQFGGFTDVLIGQDFQDWLISPYVGIIPLILIIFAFGRKKKQTMFFLGTAIIGLLLAFGHYTPFYRLVFLIPGVSLIRYPVKYLFLVTFSLAVLAAFGFDHLYQAEREWLKKQVRIIWFVAGGLAIAFGLAFLLRQQIFSWLAGHYSARMPNYFFELLADMIGFNLLSFFFVVVYIAGLAVILMMYSRQLIRPVFFVFLLISLIAADLLANGANIAVPVSAWVMNKIPTNYQLLQKEQKMGRLFYTPELERENRLILGKNYDDALFEAKDNLTANWGIPAQIYDFYGYESVLPYKMYNFYRQNFKTIQLEKLSRYNVSFIAAERPIKLPGLRLLRHKKKYQLNVYLYENQKVRERAYLLLPGECTIKSYRPGNIIVQTATKQLNRLFLAESYYPGWRVYIDGREGKLRSAEELFCGVDLPAGEHLVSFTYQPLSFYLGTWLSGLTIVLMVAGGLFYFKKNR